MGRRLSGGDKSEMRWYFVLCQPFLAYHASHCKSSMYAKCLILAFKHLRAFEENPVKKVWGRFNHCSIYKVFYFRVVLYSGLLYSLGRLLKNERRHNLLTWKSAVIKDPFIQKKPFIVNCVFEVTKILNGYHYALRCQDETSSKSSFQIT